jgi:2,3-diaminopropionate biosynthesis protein SbnA
VTASSIIDLIGNTPLLELSGLNTHYGTQIFAKLECANPGGSIKDRTALGLVRQALREGKLKPGMTVVESTSGNLGYSLAILAKVYGFKFTCVVDPKTPSNNILFYRAYGAKVEVVDEVDADGGYQKNRIARAREIAAADPDTINLDQYSNRAAQDIHYETTGPEIYQQMQGSVDAIVASVSTGSHLSGIARYLRQENPKLQVVAVEPDGSVIFGGKYHPYRQNGSGLSFRPGNYSADLVDAETKVADEAAFQMVQEVLDRDALLVGPSSGAVLYAAVQYSLQQPDNKPRCVVVLPDSGVKYLA